MSSCQLREGCPGVKLIAVWEAEGPGTTLAPEAQDKGVDCLPRASQGHREATPVGPGLHAHLMPQLAAKKQVSSSVSGTATFTANSPHGTSSDPVAALVMCLGKKQRVTQASGVHSHAGGSGASAWSSPTLRPFEEWPSRKKVTPPCTTLPFK